MSTPELPRPEGFGDSDRGGAIAAGILVFVLSGVGFVIMLASSIGEGSAPRVLFSAAGIAVSASFVAAFFAILNAQRSRFPTSVNASSPHSEPALVLPMYRPFNLPFALLSAAGSVFALAYGVLLFTRDSGTNSIRDYLYCASMLALAGFSAWLSTTFFSALVKHHQLIISEQGIEIHSNAVDQTIAWESIEEILATQTNNNPTVVVTPTSGDVLHTSRSSALVRKLKANRRYLREMIIDVHFYRVDPVLIYHLLRFYWKNSGARKELKSNAVIDRLHRGDLLG
ncbi:NADH-quinone oxidoreductase subunit J [Nocardia carnea]|uniref:NADH-quinone oxidoreductase subunit J n=1 Tax=Nocardia carnea TaxID=37328 RepID=UPI0012DBD913|nr:NADH-quinone oxidoreductase subunit J [Nocardia carnea]